MDFNQFLSDNNEWIKALHLIAMVAWMCGMLYLPRLFVYHTQVKGNAQAEATFITMERKLMRAIMLPAMLATILFGVLMAVSFGMEYVRTAYWLHAKIALVLGMAAIHGRLSWHRKQLATGTNTHSERYFRILNEVPAVLLVLIILLVVLKPF